MKIKGFTLIELLIVIAIIGLLSSVVLASLNSAREKAYVARDVAQLRELTKIVALYYHDTNQFPADCRLTCTSATDPFLNSLGVSGWQGPYFTMYNFTHSWGGHFGGYSADYNSDGINEYYLILDDDKPGTDSNNNQGVVPRTLLLRMDQILDDGNLATGIFTGDGDDLRTAKGEAILRVSL